MSDSGLNKLILNNFIVKNRDNVRKAKGQVITKIIRRTKQLRQHQNKATDDKAKEKFGRKADRYVEQLTILKKFHADDLTKFALMNKKSVSDATDDVDSQLEERALCRVASWKTVVPEIDKFKEQYPDYEEKLPDLLKSIGLQYRKKRLFRLERKGRKDNFLEKEHHNITILQKLTHIDVDPRLLAKARDLMQISKKEGSVGQIKPDRKTQRDGKHISEKSGVESQDDKEVSGYEGETDRAGKQGKREKKLSKKEPKIKKQSEKSIDKNGSGIRENLEESISKKISAIEDESDLEEESASEKESDLGKSPVKTQEESASEKESDLGKSSAKTQERCTKKAPKTTRQIKEQGTDDEDEGISEDENIRDKCGSNTLKNSASDSLKDKILMEEEKEESDEDEKLSDEEDAGYGIKRSLGKNTSDKEQYEYSGNISSGESDMSADEESGTDASDDESEDDEASIKEHHVKGEKENTSKNKRTSKKSLLRKQKETSTEKGDSGKKDEHVSEKKKGKLNTDTDGNLLSDNEGSIDLNNIESDDEGGIDFDSGGSVIDENYEPLEITSIWDDVKKKGDKGKSKESGTKSKKVTENISGGGNKVIKKKGTVEVRRIDLTDQKSMDVLFEGNSAEVSSDDDDFFVREPTTKKRKRPKQNDNNDNEVAASESDEGEEVNDDIPYSDEETSTRERYLDKNFKRIWGRGMEETIQVSRGRRGAYITVGGRGRGFGDNRGIGFGDNRGRGYGDNRGRGYDDNRGRGYDGGRGRGGRGQANSNFLPLGSDLPSEQGYGNSNNPSSERRNFGNANTSSVSSEWKDGDQSRPKSNWGGFESRGRGHTGNRFDRGEDEPLKPGWKRGRFERRDPNNANLAPVSGSRKDDNTPGEDAQGSMLHPSWMAKQKERERTSSIHNFQGKVKKFDDTQSKREDAQGSLLHPSWMAKQKERELASSLHNFQGKVKKFDDTQSKREDVQGSMHPSWMAKQKQRELASSIHNFQGKVKKFDFDD